MTTLTSVLKFSGFAAPVIAMISLLTPAISMAHPCDIAGHAGYGYDRVYVVSTRVSESLTYTSDQCKVGEPLKLSRTPHDYPLLGQLEVDYWKGSYVRTAQVKTVYQDAVFSCRDGYLGSMPRESVELRSVPFAVANPNLSDDVAASYVANAPMTNSEAQVEFEKALDACQNASAR